MNQHKPNMLLKQQRHREEHRKKELQMNNKNEKSSWLPQLIINDSLRQSKATAGPPVSIHPPASVQQQPSP